MKFLLSCIVCTFALSRTVTFGQVGDAVDRSQLFRTQPGMSNGTPIDNSTTALGYAASSANDADLGVQAILKRQEEYKPFLVSLSASYYWTSNVALTPSGEVSDGVFAPLGSVGYVPHLWKTFYGEFGAVQQLFYYNRYSSFNFTSFDGFAGLAYYLPQFYNLALRIRYDFNRLTTDEWDEFFSNHQLLFMAELPYRFGRAMQLTVGGVANISLAADQELPRRNEFDAYVGYQVQVTRALSLDAGARFQLKEYHEGDRRDVSEILALTANYRLREWLTLSGITNVAWNQSNHDVFEYDVANLGGALTLNIKF